ncbi:MAG: biotin/lipoyl-binding protein [Chloroflexi bacterium]|nr:biotin/lipoyl-binding protein [Chloroflexota bacterium]
MTARQAPGVDRTPRRDPGPTAAEEARIVDPRAVRVGVAAPSGRAGGEAIVIEPPEVPLAPAPHVVGTGILGGISAESIALAEAPDDDDGIAIVDGTAVRARLERLDDVHGVLTVLGDAGPVRTPVLLLPLERHAGPSSGVVRREVVVDGWQVEVEIESERRASLRERARRGREETAHGGPTHVRAIIPGRIVSVSVVPGDPVEAGQQLLVVEAMKMQNELRAPRDGVVSSVSVGVGGTIEVGDLLLVLE